MTHLRQPALSILPPPGSERRARNATPRRLLTVDEVRAELNIGRTLVYQLVETGALPVVRVGHALRVRPADLEAFVEANLISRVVR
jgi:excisionase family DNA binding protein